MPSEKTVGLGPILNTPPTHRRLTILSICGG